MRGSSRRCRHADLHGKTSKQRVASAAAAIAAATCSLQAGTATKRRPCFGVVSIAQQSVARSISRRSGSWPGVRGTRHPNCSTGLLCNDCLAAPATGTVWGFAQRSGVSVVAAAVAADTHGACKNGLNAVQPQRWKVISRFVFVAFACVVLYSMSAIFIEPLEEASVAELCEQLLAKVGELGYFGHLVFLCTYAFLDMVGVPPAALAASAGALFGPFGGFILVLLGCVAGAAGAFLLGRWLLQARARELVRASATLKAVDEAVARRGFQVILLMRLVPTPIPGLNWLFGTTGISFRTYVAATALGYVPITAFFVSVGVAGRSVATGGAYSLQALRRCPWPVCLLGSVAAAALAVCLQRTARNALQDAAQPQANADVFAEPSAPRPPSEAHE